MKKVEEEARFDGKWVLRTNTNLSAEKVALKYKELWQVEMSHYLCLCRHISSPLASPSHLCAA
jgi:hypothetical protein